MLVRMPDACFHWNDECCPLGSPPICGPGCHWADWKPSAAQVTCGVLANSAYLWQIPLELYSAGHWAHGPQATLVESFSDYIGQKHSHQWPAQLFIPTGQSRWQPLGVRICSRFLPTAEFSWLLLHFASLEASVGFLMIIHSTSRRLWLWFSGTNKSWVEFKDLLGPYQALLEWLRACWNLLSALETVLGDAVNLLVMRLVFDVPSCKDYMTTYHAINRDVDPSQMKNRGSKSWSVKIIQNRWGGTKISVVNSLFPLQCTCW